MLSSSDIAQILLVPKCPRHPKVVASVFLTYISQSKLYLFFNFFVSFFALHLDVIKFCTIYSKLINFLYP